MVPRHKFISGSVLDLARKTDSNISPTPPLLFTGGGQKVQNLASIFHIWNPLYADDWPMSFPKLVLFGTRKSDKLAII